MMGIQGDAQQRPIRTLSMGEKTRVATACLTYGTYDFLVLDEPTNHLDAQARDAIESALKSFPGSILVATHDRYFLDIVCDTIWRLDKGELTMHEGNYTCFQESIKKTTDTPLDAARKHEREARALAIRANMAYLISKISSVKNESEKAELNRQHDELAVELRTLQSQR